jgi:DNA-binding NtrC family response regulator
MQDHPQENLSTGTAEKPGFPAAYVTFIPFPSQTARDRVPRILIVEDEVFIALMIEEMVREIGYEVSGTVHNIAMARQEFAKKNFDAVLLDISVGGRRDPETADFLLKAGVPFAFVTGYDYLVEPRHEKIPVLQKPFVPAQILSLLEKLVGPASSSSEIAQAQTGTKGRNG